MKDTLKHLRRIKYKLSMLWVYNSFKNVHKFKDVLKQGSEHFLDLSTLPSSKLVQETQTIIGHYASCTIYLGYLEPGFMLEPTHQVLLRKLFRKFRVGVVTMFIESIPFSWKNEIDYFYFPSLLNDHGTGDLNDGSTILHESNSGYKQDLGTSSN